MVTQSGDIEGSALKTFNFKDTPSEQSPKLSEIAEGNYLQSSQN